MRTAEETMSLFKQVLYNRRNYVRSKLKEARHEADENRPNRGRPRAGLEAEQMMRGGMLSELSTIECVLKMIESGDKDPLTYWSEWSEPQAHETTASPSP